MKHRQLVGYGAGALQTLQKIALLRSTKIVCLAYSTLSSASVLVFLVAWGMWAPFLSLLIMVSPSCVLVDCDTLGTFLKLLHQVGDTATGAPPARSQRSADGTLALARIQQLANAGGIECAAAAPEPHPLAINSPDAM
jgi:hypothetical protein